MLAVLLLAGCAGEPAREVVEVKVPVAAPCIAQAPVRPTYHFGAGDWPGEKPAALLLTSDLEAAKQYGVAWEAAAAGCITSRSAGH